MNPLIENKKLNNGLCSYIEGLNANQIKMGIANISLKHCNNTYMFICLISIVYIHIILKIRPINIGIFIYKYANCSILGHQNGR